jgi:hypothetical protein
LTQQISDRGTAERAEQTRHLASAVESLRTICQQAEDSVARLRSQGEQAEAQIADRAAESMREVDEVARQSEVSAAAQREALSAAASEIQAQVTAVLSAAHSSWRSQLNSEVEAAQDRWHATLETTLAAAQEKAAAGLNEQVRSLLPQLQDEAGKQSSAARESMTAAAAGFDEHVRGLLSQLQDEAGRYTGAVRESMSGAATEAEQRMASLRNSLQEQAQGLEGALGRAAESSDRLEHFSARIETAQGHALASFETQIGDVLSLHRNELHRQSETLLEEINARIRSTFEENCQLAISRFDQQIDSLVQPHVSRTEEAIHRLAGGRSLLDAALTLQQDRIRTSADEAFAESLARFRENLGGVDQLLQEAAQTVAARNLAEIESRTSDLKHQTVDDLMKSADPDSKLYRKNGRAGREPV